MEELTPPGHGDIQDHYELNDKQLTWMDLTGEDAVVTIKTITEPIYNEWTQSQTREDREFNYENIRQPGAYHDTDMPNPDKMEGYTVVVPVQFLDPEIMALAIEKLNEEHGTEFEIPNAETENFTTDDLFDYT